MMGGMQFKRIQQNKQHFASNDPVDTHRKNEQFRQPIGHHV